MISKKKIIYLLSVFLGTIFLLIFIQAEVVTVTKVYHWSMKPALLEGDLLIVEKVSYRFEQPKRGDIIIILKETNEGFESTHLGRFIEDYRKRYNKEKPRVRYVKRIIGVPGDVVDIKGGEVYVNGEHQEEPYVLGRTVDHKGLYPKILPEGCYFVMGDNREASLDSRTFGYIDEKQIESKMWLKIGK